MRIEIPKTFEETNVKIENLYNIRIFKNDVAMLAHVAINLVNARTASLAGRHGKMTWVVRSDNNVALSSGHFHDGFMFMLANTNRKDWKEEIVYENLYLEKAREIKKSLSEELIETGYMINSNNATGCSPHGTEHLPNYVNRLVIDPNKTTMKKFKAFCEKCTNEMNLSKQKFSLIYREYYNKIFRLNSNDIVTRYDVWKAYKEISNIT